MFDVLNKKMVNKKLSPFWSVLKLIVGYLFLMCCVSKMFVFLKFWEVPGGWERSGRLAGTMPCYFRPDPTWWCRVMTKKPDIRQFFKGHFKCFSSVCLIVYGFMFVLWPFHDVSSIFLSTQNPGPGQILRVSFSKVRVYITQLFAQTTKINRMWCDVMLQ